MSDNMTILKFLNAVLNLDQLIRWHCINLLPVLIYKTNNHALRFSK